MAETYTTYVACRTALHVLVSEIAKGVFIVEFFFFQAEDGIRDLTVTGVQTCALPISRRSVEPRRRFARSARPSHRDAFGRSRASAQPAFSAGDRRTTVVPASAPLGRS